MTTMTFRSRIKEKSTINIKKTHINIGTPSIIGDLSRLSQMLRNNGMGSVDPSDIQTLVTLSVLDNNTS
jgi:hypothetical protein